MLLPVSTKLIPVSTESAIKTAVVEGFLAGWLRGPVKADADKGVNNSNNKLRERAIVSVSFLQTISM